MKGCLILNKYVEVEFVEIEEKKELLDLINKIVNECFKTEQMQNINMYLNIILTNPEHIKQANQKYRNIDKETYVLSFPMFEKEEIEEFKIKPQKIEEVLGDIIISVSRVEEQSKEYGHSFERELAYMVVHGFYHIIGYDHMEEEDKKQMRQKEEIVLEKLNIKRN